MTTTSLDVPAIVLRLQIFYMKILALSSSRVGNGAYLASALPLIDSFLGKQSLQVAFIPFAAVDGDYKAYADKVREGLSSLPHEIKVVSSANDRAMIENADVVMIGGGNTFKLLHDLYAHDLFSIIKQKVLNGTPYVGWSAGSNLTGETICTTNDMPIIQPQSFSSFGFLPFQINPHYHNAVIEGFNGETRDQRLIEFLLLRPGTPVVGLPEGTALLHTGEELRLVGERSAVLFQNSKEDTRVAKIELLPETDLSFLVNHKE